MSWDGSGTYNRFFGSTGWTDDKNASTKILASRHDTHDQDIATALNNTITRDNQGKPTTNLTWTGVTLQAKAFIPSDSTVPANGVYLPAANTVGIASNTTLRWSVNSTGNHVIAAPSSGVAVAITGVAGGTSQTWTDGTRGVTLNHSASRVDFGASTGDTLSLLSSNTRRVEIGSAGNVTINAPTSGTALTVTGVSTTVPLIVNGAVNARLANYANGTETVSLQNDPSSNYLLGVDGAHSFSIYTNGAGNPRIAVSSAGNVAINAPASGTTLAILGIAATASTGIAMSGSTTGLSQFTITSTSGSLKLGTESSTGAAIAAGTASYDSVLATANATQLWLGTNGVARLGVSTSGNVTINAPSSGVSLAVSGVSGTHSATIADAAANGGLKVGYLNIPQNAQAGNYTCVLADSGKHIFHNSGDGAGDTYTIPANASVAYDVGTALTFVNRDSNSVSIAITTDTMYLGGTTTTGTRTLGENGVATAIKVASTTWIITGTNLT